MRRASIRLRLALWCAALVTVSGAVLIIGVLAITATVLHDRGAEAPAPGARPGALAPPRPLAGGRQAETVRRGSIVDQTLAEAREIGLIAVGGLALTSLGIGWLVAGRMLRPVRELADVAQRVSGTSLEHRITPDGPHDELRELAEAFDRMLERLDDAFSAQRRFVADAAHELRTPLATIRAELDDLLADPSADAERVAAAGARIAAVLDRSDALVSALLTLSRSDAVAAREPVDLSELAGDVLTTAPGADRLDLRLSLEHAPVLGDRALLDRLAGNLIENAIRYNAPGGLLAVSTADGDGTARLIVENDGSVVDPADVPRLVERFQRRSRTAGGHGLGLAICDAIARGHGGTLTLEARPTGGLRAVVRLPAGSVAGDGDAT